MPKRKAVKLPDSLPGGRKGEFGDIWKERPEEFDFPENEKTTLTCKKCNGTFFTTGRRTKDHHHDELICDNCERIVLVGMEHPASSRI